MSKYNIYYNMCVYLIYLYFQFNPMTIMDQIFYYIKYSILNYTLLMNIY